MLNAICSSYRNNSGQYAVFSNNLVIIRTTNLIYSQEKQLKANIVKALICFKERKV